MLLDVRDEGAAVDHDGPASIATHEHGDGCRCGFNAGAGRGVLELRFDEGGRRLHRLHVRHVGYRALLHLCECNGDDK